MEDVVGLYRAGKKRLLSTVWRLLLAKKFKSLDAENDNLKSEMEELENEITKASKSANAGFKRKKIRSMKREADKITEKLSESEKALKLLEPRVSKDPISGAHLKLTPSK